MRGVGLTYKGQPVRTNPDFTIDWEHQIDILDFDRLSNGFSYPISIPRAGNEHIFFGVGEPDSPRSFTTIDGFSITDDGNDIWQVSLELHGVSDDEKNYEGTLTTIEPAIFEKADKSIREILRDITWSYPAGGHNTVYAYFNGSTNRGIRFPWMHFYNEVNYAFPLSDPEVYIINQDSFAVPCFHMAHILRLLMQEAGYSVIFNLTETHYQNLLVYSPTQFKISGAGGSQSYGAFLPEISLNDFIREVEFYTGGKVYVDISNKKLIIESHQYQRARGPLDLTDKNIGSSIPGKFPYRHMVARMNYQDDYLLTENPIELEGNYLGEYEDAQTISLLPGTAEGDYAFALAENAYYKFFTINGSLELEYYSHPFLERKTGTDDTYIFESQLSPCIKDRYHYGEFEVEATLLEGPASPVPGKCVIQGFSDPTIVTDYDYIGILEFEARERKISKPLVSGKQKIRNFGVKALLFNRFGINKSPTWNVIETAKKITNEYYIGYRKPVLYQTYSSSTGANPDDNKFHMVLEYNGDAAVRKVIVAKQLPYYIPIIGKRLNRGLETDQVKASNDPDNSGGILTWHGMQYQFNKIDQYPYASCDNFYFNTTDGVSELPAMSLNLHVGTNNLWTNIFNPLFILFRSMKPIRLKASLTSEDLRNLVTKRIVRYAKGIFLLKAFRTSYGPNGISPQEIEGYSL